MTPQPIVLFCLVTTFWVFESRLAAEPNDAGSGWRAQWIGPKTTGSNHWFCFRHTASLESVPPFVPARIAVDSKYWLWINGQLAIFEGGLKRGPTPENTYYDQVDIAPYLRRGNNTIDVLIWYWGKNGFSHNSSGQAGLIFQAQTGKQTIASDGTWKVLPHPAYGQGDPPYPNYRLSESNIHFDARKDIPDWIHSGFDDADWPVAKSFGAPPVAPWNDLEPRPIPEWRDGGLKNYVRTITTNTTNDDRVLTAFLPYDAQVTPWLRVKAPAGSRIDIRTDDYMGGGSPNVRSVYITRDGIQKFESLGWMNGHWVTYTAPAGVKVLAVKYRETGYKADFTGAFHCDDPVLNTLWQKARRTLNVTMRDNYMDCPDRERAQWWGDEVNELGETFYALDATNGPLLARKGIRELARWQRADHTLFSPVPSGQPATDVVRKDLQDGSWTIELPIQMLAAVGRYGFWTYYLYTGDKDTITVAYPHVRDYLQLWKQDASGLVVHRTGDWDWEDWGENIDAPVMDSAWYELALQGAIKMAQVVGQDADIPVWQAQQAVLEKSFNANFWTGHEYRSPGYQGDTDDRANALAVVGGLARPEQYADLRMVFAKHYNASPYMEKYVLEALYQMNAPDEARQRMKSRWKDQIESWTTTLWEGWGIGAKGYGGGTYNHAWSGGALTLLSQYAAGVAPEQPGYEVYHVLPSLGGLRSIRAAVPSPKGLIRVQFTQNEEQVECDLVSPAGTKAIVGMPRPAGRQFKQIAVNRSVVWGQKARNLAGIVFQSADDRYLRFKVKPGHWHFIGTIQ